MRYASLALGVSLVAGCGDSTKCGLGTLDVDGLCVPELQCGEGTVQEGDQCVPATGAGPTITSITPSLDLIGGGAEFTIEGTGFKADGAGDTEVVFGDTAAVFEIVSDTQLRGTVPRGAKPRVELRVANQNGEAKTNFQYVGLIGADGNQALPGKLWLLDPRDGSSVAIGPIVDAAGTGYPVTGLAFAPDGTLYATEPTSPTEEGGGKKVLPGPPPVQARIPHLLTIDPLTGRATVVGELMSAEEIHHSSIADITFTGTTLVGWTELEDAAVSIDPGTGVVTLLGAGRESAGSGMATLADGTTVVAPSGSLYTVNLDDGSTTELVPITLDAELPFEICALTSAGTTLFALFCDDSEGAGALKSSILGSIDTTTGVVTLLGPGPTGLDAIAAPAGLVLPAGAPTTPAAQRSVLATKLERAATCARAAGSIELSGARAGRVTMNDLATSPRSVAVPAKRAGVRGLGLDALAADGAVSVTACSGEAKQIARDELASFVLVANQRGRIKLVDRRSGRPVLKNVTSLRAE